MQALDRVTPTTGADQVISFRYQVTQRTTVVAERNTAVHATSCLVLQRLSLYGTKGTSTGMRNLRKLSSVTLDGTWVDGETITYLTASAPTLEELSLAHTPVSN